MIVNLMNVTSFCVNNILWTEMTIIDRLLCTVCGTVTLPIILSQQRLSHRQSPVITVLTTAVTRTITCTNSTHNLNIC